MKKKSKILLFILSITMILSTVACTQQTTGNKETKDNKAETKNKEPKEISKEELKNIEKAINNTFNQSFRYDKNYGTYIGVQAVEEEVDKNISEAEMKEHLTGFRYYTKIEQPNGKLLLQKYLVPKHVKELGQRMEGTSLKTKGVFNKFDDKYKIYNENVVFVDKDSEPVLREYYSDGILIKEGGRTEKVGKGVKINRLPDENIFTYALLNSIPLEKIFEAGKKTSYLNMPVTSDKKAYYIYIREYSATMFANEIFKIMLENPKYLDKYLDELKLYGVDVNDPDGKGYKALSRQYYVDSKVDLETLLREGTRYLRLCGFFWETDKIPELIKEKGFDINLPLGKILPKQYETGYIPFNNNHTALYLNIEKSDQNKPYITMITKETIYNNYIGDLEQIFLMYDHDEQSKILEKNMDSLSKVEKFNGEFNPLYTAKMRMLTYPKYLERITESIPYDVFYQDWYNYVRNVNMENKLDPGKLNSDMLNGLQKTKKYRGQYTDKTTNWIMDIIFMNNLGECANCSELGDKLFKITGENNFGKKEKKNIEQEYTLNFYNPIKDGMKYYGKDNDTDISIKFERTDGNKDKILFKYPKKEDVSEHTLVFLEKLNNTYGKDAKEEDKQPIAKEGETLKKDYDKMRKEIGYKEGNLVDYNKLLDNGAWNALKEGDGYYQVHRLSYNKKLSDVEMINSKGQKVKVSDVIDKNKDTLLVYGDTDCPFCIRLFETLSSNEKMWKDKYNVVIFAKYNKEDLEESGKEHMDTVKKQNPDGNYDKAYKFVKKHMYFGAREFSRNFQIDYKPTIFYLNKDGYAYYVSSGATTQDGLKELLKNVDNLHDLEKFVKKEETNGKKD